MAIPLNSKEQQFDSAAVTHRGNLRQNNEDSIFANPEMGLWLVADGMGGHRDGKLASGLIAEAARKITSRGSLDELAADLRFRIASVNEALVNISNGQHDLIAGSTVAALLLGQASYCCLWIGDSRCYLVRAAKIMQLSHDHTEVQHLVDEGAITQAEAKCWPRRHVITRAVGVDRNLGLEQVAGTVEPGDCFVLCSDGLTGHVDDGEILAATQRSTAEATCDKLLALALQRGGKDNISIIIVNVASRDATIVVSRW